MTEKITTQEEYDNVKQQVEILIGNATEKRMLEPEMDNDYTCKIAELSRKMANYENDYLGLQTLRGKEPLA